MKTFIRRLALFFGNLFFKAFMRVKALPIAEGGIEQSVQGKDHPIIFVLRSDAALDEIAFLKCCKAHHLDNISLCYLPTKFSPEAISLFFKQISDHLSDTTTYLVPVSIFWGRMPALGKGFWKTYLSENLAVVGFFRRILTVIMQRKQIFCYFGSPLPLDSAHLPTAPQTQQVLIDQIEEQFNRQKEAVVGPDLSHQRIIADKVINDPKVRQTIEDTDEDRQKLEKKAHAYIHEIASNYSYPVVRLLEYFLTWLWERLYHGVEVTGLDKLQSVAEDHEIVYVPCHRSHIDYLLLSYVIYNQGLMPPHVAAGINLNLPVVGKILRGGGAFFIRRKFRDNKLYRAVLESYLTIMCKEGFSIEYFIEGGRSRTGLLLQPRPGMLAMTLQAAEQENSRPLIFVPVYIGYEKLFESHSYIKELYGSKKEKESITALLSTIKYLKKDFGRVYLNIGNPISVEDIYRDTQLQTSNDDFKKTVTYLGEKILTNINASASVTPMNLMAISLLSSPQYAMFDYQLKLQVTLLTQLCRLPHYKDTLIIHEADFDDALNHAFQLDLVAINHDERSKIIFLEQGGRVSATFLRNNNLHIFIIPSLIASIVLMRKKVTLKRLNDVCLRIYPYLKAELFLPWTIGELPSVIDHALSLFIKQEQLIHEGVFLTPADEQTETYNSLLLLANIAKGNFQRFYITTQLLYHADPLYYTAERLVDDCVIVAKQLSLLHECHEPDFFDLKLFKTFVDKLIEQNMILCDSNDRLTISESLTDASTQAENVLSSSVRRSIGYVTQNIH